jgi:hypothetical protein
MTCFRQLSVYIEAMIVTQLWPGGWELDTIGRPEYGLSKVKVEIEIFSLGDLESGITGG